MKRNLKIGLGVLLVVALGGGGFAGGWFAGRRHFLRRGYQIGLRRGSFVAPLPRDTEITDFGEEQLATELAGLEPEQREEALRLLNEGPSPCQPHIREGVSLATCLLSRRDECSAGCEGQLDLVHALAANEEVSPEWRLQHLRNRPWVGFELDDRPSLGPADAPLTIVKFSDYQCGYCASASPVLEEVVEALGGEARLVLKQRPLRMHPQAPAASLAALAAGRQDRYWEMHELLFSRMRRLPRLLGDEEAPFLTLAEELGLDPVRYREDCADPALRAIVEEDTAEATALGVNGTPTIFLNGIRYRGNREVEAVLAEARRHLDAGGRALAALPDPVE